MAARSPSSSAAARSRRRGVWRSAAREGTAQRRRSATVSGRPRARQEGRERVARRARRRLHGAEQRLVEALERRERILEGRRLTERREALVGDALERAQRLARVVGRGRREGVARREEIAVDDALAEARAAARVDEGDEARLRGRQRQRVVGGVPAPVGVGQRGRATPGAPRGRAIRPQLQEEHVVARRDPLELERAHARRERARDLIDARARARRWSAVGGVDERLVRQRGIERRGSRGGARSERMYEHRHLEVGGRQAAARGVGERRGRERGGHHLARGGGHVARADVRARQENSGAHGVRAILERRRGSHGEARVGRGIELRERGGELVAETPLATARRRARPPPRARERDLVGDRVGQGRPGGAQRAVERRRHDEGAWHGRAGLGEAQQ